MPYANSGELDQTLRSSLIRVITVCLTSKQFKKQRHKEHNLSQKRYGIKCSELGQLLYSKFRMLKCNIKNYQLCLVDVFDRLVSFSKGVW